MSAATFGDLAQAASGHLHEAGRLPVAGLDAASIAAVVAQGHRLTRALIRYLDDVIAEDRIDLDISDHAAGSLRAAAQARESLQMAAANLRAAAGDLGPAGQDAGLLADELAQAVACVHAGRDLLTTHLPGDAGPAGTPGSPWPAVLASPAVTGALLDQVARWSGQLAACTGSLAAAAAANPAIPPAAGPELHMAHRRLLLASTAISQAPMAGHVIGAARALLGAVPASQVPEPRPLTGPELLDELCAGVTAGAARLRAVAARWPDDYEALAPELTTDSWQWTAFTTAVITDISELLLRSLAQRAGQPGGPLASVRQPLADAAGAARHACETWRAAAAAWGELTTATSGLTAPAVADAGDLVTRLGRIAFTDPVWTPARSRRAQPRDPADLAPGADEAKLVLSAVHDTADALAALSATDQATIRTAARSGQLYLPTYLLPDYYDAQHKYGPPPPTVTRKLRKAYTAAVTASAQLADALNAAAIAAGAPTQVLAAARVTAREHAKANKQPPGTGQAASAQSQVASTARQPRPGLVEHLIRDLGVTDALILLRAKAIDKATRNLITQAHDAVGQFGDAIQPAGDSQSNPAVATAADVASRSFPPIHRTPIAGRRGSRPDGRPSPSPVSDSTQIPPRRQAAR